MSEIDREIGRIGNLVVLKRRYGNQDEHLVPVADNHHNDTLCGETLGKDPTWVESIDEASICTACFAKTPDL